MRQIYSSYKRTFFCLNIFWKKIKLSKLNNCCRFTFISPINAVYALQKIIIFLFHSFEICKCFLKHVDLSIFKIKYLLEWYMYVWWFLSKSLLKTYIVTSKKNVTFSEGGLLLKKT